VGVHKDQIVLKPYAFNNSSFLIDKTHNAQFVQVFSAEYVNDTSDIDEADDGLGVPVDFSTKKGLIKISVKQYSPTHKKLWDLFKSGVWFEVSFADSSVEDLKTSSKQCKAQKPPIVSRQKGPEVVEWILNANYLDCRDGGLKLVA
jgi:hypothetical protein